MEGNNEKSEKIDKLLDECQTYKYNQSSNFIQLSRTVIFGIIGTIWILSYSDGSFNIHNTCQIVSLLFAFTHIFIDLLHYFWDMIFYKREYVKLDADRDNVEAVKEHDKRMDCNANVSFAFVCINSFVLLMTAISFVKGFIFQFNIFNLN